MPKDKSFLYYKGPPPGQVRSPVCIYADFECLISEGNLHEAAAFRMSISVPEGCRLVCTDFHYTGADAHIVFVRKLLDLMPELMQKCYPKDDGEYYKPCEEGVEQAFEQATTCYLCGKTKVKIEVKTDLVDWIKQQLESGVAPGSKSELNEEAQEMWENAIEIIESNDFKGGKNGNYEKKLSGTVAAVIKEKFPWPTQDDRFVKEHCHVTGRYRGKAHATCNTKIEARHLPVFFHNTRGYDGHLILKAISVMSDPDSSHFDERLSDCPPRHMKRLRLRCVAGNSQKMKFFSMGAYRFFDSIQHLTDSLDNLLSSVAEEKMHSIKSISHSTEQFALIRQKLPFPYEWWKSLDQLKILSLAIQTVTRASCHFPWHRQRRSWSMGVSSASSA
jgi:hypothetical protein